MGLVSSLKYTSPQSSSRRRATSCRFGVYQCSILGKSRGQPVGIPGLGDDFAARKVAIDQVREWIDLDFAHCTGSDPVFVGDVLW